MFDLSVTVDFDDDVQSAPFDREMFRQMMRTFRGWGMRRVYWIDYGDLWMRHRLAGWRHDPRTTPVTRVLVESADDRPVLTTADNVHLYASHDNLGYVPCDAGTHPRLTKGPGPRGEGMVWRLEWQGLRVDAPYLLLHSEVPWGGLANRWDRLVRLYADGGEELPSTPGVLIPHFRGVDDLAVVHNHAPGCPTGGSSWQMDYVRTRLDFSICGEAGAMGVAVGVDERLPVLCPAEPDARALWIAWVQECLDDGADGVDFRPGSHCSPFDWRDYGYNGAVIDAYKRRHHMDISRHEPHEEKKARILGEGYTAFLREASAAIRSRGKVVGHHVQSDFFPATDNPETGLSRAVFFMGIGWDVAGWLSEGLIDEITVKGPTPGCWDDTRRRIVAMAHRAGLPYRYCPWHSDAKGRPLRYEAIRHQIARAREDTGATGFNVYESAAVLDIQRGSVSARVAIA